MSCEPADLLKIFVINLGFSLLKLAGYNVAVFGQVAGAGRHSHMSQI